MTLSAKSRRCVVAGDHTVDRLENPKVLRPEIGDQYRTRFGHDRGANEALPCRIQGSVQGAEVLAIGRNDGGLRIHVMNRLLIYYPLVPTTA
jgi:hypothetical protein